MWMNLYYSTQWIIPWVIKTTTTNYLAICSNINPVVEWNYYFSMLLRTFYILLRDRWMNQWRMNRLDEWSKTPTSLNRKDLILDNLPLQVSRGEGETPLSILFRSLQNCSGVKGFVRGVLSCERWAMSRNTEAVSEERFLEIHALVPYIRGILA